MAGGFVICLGRGVMVTTALGGGVGGSFCRWCPGGVDVGGI